MTNSLKLILLLCVITVCSPGAASETAGAGSLASDLTTKASYFQNISHPFKLLFSTCGRRAKPESLSLGSTLLSNSSNANADQTAESNLTTFPLQKLRDDIRPKLYNFIGLRGICMMGAANRELRKAIEALYTSKAQNASTMDEFLHCAPFGQFRSKSAC